MDYYKIGQRVRTYRRAKGLSQEALAERAGISVTHMSHIETGNTKLSLSVFLALADGLGVSADSLLRDSPSGQSWAGELAGILEGCAPWQAQVILEVARAARTALDRHPPQHF